MISYTNCLLYKCIFIICSRCPIIFYFSIYPRGRRRHGVFDPSCAASGAGRPVVRVPAARAVGEHASLHGDQRGLASVEVHGGGIAEGLPQFPKIIVSVAVRVNGPGAAAGGVLLDVREPVAVRVLPCVVAGRVEQIRALPSVLHPVAVAVRKIGPRPQRVFSLAARPAVSPVARTVGRCSVGMCRDGVRVPPVRTGRGQAELI